LLLIVRGNLTIGPAGEIVAHGKAGGGSVNYGGGGSGGGSIGVLYAGALDNSGTIAADGGPGGRDRDPGQSGYAGGAGSVQIAHISQ
jgi:hypothetical protein